MQRIAHIENGHIVNVSLSADDAVLTPGTMLESKAIEQGIPRFVAPSEVRKIWPDKSKFWDEFTADEKALILTSEHSGIKVLWSDLTMWPGEVWSDDARIQQGLSGLVAVKILTESRKTEILTK